MIVSASRRTDIPAYYGQWLLNRLRERYVLVQNPYNKNRYAKVALSRDVVDCLVFWTKNPTPMLRHLREIDEMGHTYYFQFTLTPYAKEMEQRLPDKQRLLDVFCALSDAIGSGRVVWRYDPIIINESYTVDFHIKAFAQMAKQLRGHTKRCIISFVDCYRTMSTQVISELCGGISEEKIRLVAKAFGEIARENEMQIDSCAEETNLLQYGIGHGACIDKTIIEEIVGYTLNAGKDKNQRPACGCIESIDIGAYDSCIGGCRYCYAVKSVASAQKNSLLHDSASPCLIGTIGKESVVTERSVESLRGGQLKMW